jgi:anti-sigma regulatory factor (Ser/Thr protein kinase)
MITSHDVVPVAESSQPSSARMRARELAERAGFDGTDAHRVGLVTTELATNLVKHAGTGGEILMRTTHCGPAAEVELLSIDRGPGMRDVSQSMGDGHSTSGSPGTGLGAIQRLSDDFDIYSQAGKGTVVLARLRARRAPASTRTLMRVGVVSVPKAGEDVCGDGWCVRHLADGLMALIADGLGHGPIAAEAARAAIAAFDDNPQADPAAALEAIHDGLRHTRGAAVAIADVRPGSQVVKYAGVGNIAAVMIQNGTSRQAVSHNGTLGHRAQHFREFAYPWTPGGLIVMHSDGLISHWSLDGYAGLKQRDPVVVAAILYRDFSRQRDDVTVLVAREST